MKHCPECRSTKASERFGRDRSAEDGLQRRCWACYRSWYLLNSTRVLAAAAARRIVARAVAQRGLEAWFTLHHCVDCGESDLRVLELDHRDPGTRRANVSRLLNGAYVWGAIEREIAKCDVRCVNCHRRRTMEQVESWRQAAYLRQSAADAVNPPCA
jgi:hypothetical protein